MLAIHMIILCIQLELVAGTVGRCVVALRCLVIQIETQYRNRYLPTCTAIRTPESHLKGVFRRSIFLIRTFFQNFIRILGDTPKISALIRTLTYTSKKNFFKDIFANKMQ